MVHYIIMPTLYLYAYCIPNSLHHTILFTTLSLMSCHLSLTLLATGYGTILCLTHHAVYLTHPSGFWMGHYAIGY